MTSEPADLDPREAPVPGWLVVGLLLGAVALRVALGFESFWFDEAWSYALARQAGGILDIFEIRHDNNHLLNTLYLYAVRDAVGSGHWILYRVPALLAGCASIFVLWRLALRWSRAEALVVLALTATSFPLASASAQARGYSFAILASLLYAALALREPRSGQGEGRVCLGLGLLALFGVLSHGTFAYTWLAVVAWCGHRDGLRISLLRHGGPLLCLAAAYALFYSGIEVGGGPSYDRFVTIRQAISQTMALPRRGPLTWVATGVAVVLAARALWLLVRRRDLRAVFFVVALGVAPGLVIAITDPQLLYARYLLVLFPWFYWLVAVALAEGLSRAPARRAIAAALLASFVVLNLWHAGVVLAVGRDDYLKTLVYIDEHTEGPRLEIGGDHDFRNGALVRFYANRVPSGRRVVYLERSAWPESGPEWYLRHDWRAGRDPQKIFAPERGFLYERVASFEHGAGDGFQWFVYRRVELPRRLTTPASPGAPSSGR